MKKTVLIALAALCLLFTCACRVEDPQVMADQVDLTIDAYAEAGGMLSVTDSYETFETGGYSFLAAPGRTVGEVLTENDVQSLEPVLEGDAFEGWMEVAISVTVDEDGFEWQEFSLIPDAVYTTEELLALTVPEYSVMYIAKWAGIPAEDYYAPYETETVFLPSVTLMAGEGAMQMNSEEGPYEATMSVATAEPGLTFGEVLELDSLVSVTAEGKVFAGWTVYEYSAETMETSEAPVDEEGVVCLEVFEGYYMVLREYTLCRERISTGELAALECGETDHVVIASWMTADEYMAFIQEQADAIELSLEQDALTQADMNIKSGELLTLWDGAMNALLDAAMSSLSEAEAEELTAEQNDWAAAMQAEVEAAGRDYEGGSMYALVVNGEAAGQTEDRAYELFGLLN